MLNENLPLLRALAANHDGQVCEFFGGALYESHDWHHLAAAKADLPPFLVTFHDVYGGMAAIHNGGFDAFFGLEADHPRLIEAFAMIGAGYAAFVLQGALKKTLRAEDGRILESESHEERYGPLERDFFERVSEVQDALGQKVRDFLLETDACPPKLREAFLAAAEKAAPSAFFDHLGCSCHA